MIETYAQRAAGGWASLFRSEALVPFPCGFVSGLGIC